MNIFIRTSDHEAIFPFETLVGFIAANNSITGRINCNSVEAKSILGSKISTVLLGDTEGDNRTILAQARIERLNLDGNDLIVDLVISRTS